MKQSILLILMLFLFAFWLSICHNGGYNNETGTWLEICTDMWVGEGHNDYIL